MKIMIVDDEQMAIQSLEDVLCRVLGNDIEVIPAGNGQIALELARVNTPDIVFLDIEMPGMSGMELAKRLKDLCPATNLVIVTAYSEYALKAWKLHVSDYLLKPADEEDVRSALDNLRIRPDYRNSGHLLRVQCFGNFEVFNGDRILQFRRSRAKEMLAYLVTRRGASATSGELCSILWEDLDNLTLLKTYVRQYYSEIRKTLGREGLEDAVRHSRDAYSVNPEMLDCDYYRFLAMDPVAINSYQSEFMSQYSWAEMLIPVIENTVRN